MNHRAWLAEAVGTFFLVGVCTGTAALDERLGGILGPAVLSASTGGIVATMIYWLGETSGAHINPAVTLGFFLRGKLSPGLFASYLVAQVLGAVAASAIVFAAMPAEAFRGLTLPQTGLGAAFAIEVGITLALVTVILEVSLGRTWRPAAVALSVGLTVGVLCFLAGSSTGAAMNPARSIGPALAAGRMAELWLYVLAPCVGGGLAAAVFGWRRTPEAPPGRPRNNTRPPRYR